MGISAGAARGNLQAAVAGRDAVCPAEAAGAQAFCIAISVELLDEIGLFYRSR